jgi:hypothetical protein
MARKQIVSPMTEKRRNETAKDLAAASVKKTKRVSLAGIHGKRPGGKVRMAVTLEIVIENNSEDQLRAEIDLANSYADSVVKSGQMKDFGLTSYVSHRIVSISKI